MSPITIKDNQSINEAVSLYVKRKSVELDIDVQNRLNGIKNKTSSGYRNAGYKILREFFDGDQWDYVPEEGGKPRVYNFVSTTVLNYTAFLTNEPPEIDVPPEEITDPIEIERAERKETILKKILDDNNFEIQFEAAVEGGSLVGDSFFVGVFWDSKKKRIVFNYIKKAENVKPIFSDDNFTEIIGYIRDYYVAKEVAENIFGDKLAKKKIFLIEQPISSKDGSQPAAQNMTHIQEYWDDQYQAVYVNNQELDFMEHNWGFVPLIYVSNILHPINWHGISDVENVLDPQVEYNEKINDVSQIITQEAHPTIFGKNVQPIQLQAGASQIVDLGEDAELIPDPRSGKSQPLEQIIEKQRRNIFDQSGLNEIVFGGASVKEATGRALSVLMQSVNNRIKGRQTRWKMALKTLCRNIFILLEKYVPESKEIINGFYEVDIFFPSTLLRNVTDEMNKYARKLQSRYSTMKNLGVPSPKDEEKLMQKELIEDTQLQAQAQIIMSQAIMAAQQQQQQQGGGQPQLSEGDNQEAQPAAVEGVAEQSPVSPEGALAQGNQRQTGVPNIK